MLAGGGLHKYMTAGSEDGEDELDEQDLADDPIWNLDLPVRAVLTLAPYLSDK